MRCVNAIYDIRIYTKIYTFSWLTLISQPYFDEWPPPFFPSSSVLPFGFTFHIIFFICYCCCCHQLKFPLHTSSFRCVCHLFATRRICSVEIQPKINTHAHTHKHKQTHIQRSCQPCCVNVLNFMQHGRWLWIETKQINKPFKWYQYKNTIFFCETHTHSHSCDIRCAPHVRHLLQ